MTRKLPAAGGSYIRDTETDEITRAEATKPGRAAPAPKPKPARTSRGRKKETR